MAYRWSDILTLSRKKSQPYSEVKAGLLQPDDSLGGPSPSDDVPRIRRILTPTNVVLTVSLVLNVTLLLSSNLNLLLPSFFDVDMFCHQRHSTYRSPVDEDFPIRYLSERFIDLFSATKSAYAQPASKAVDEAWYDLGIQYNYLTLPEDIDPTVYGIQPWQPKRDPELGGGYIVFTEALHQLHCLNILRKTTYFDYPYYFDTSEDYKDPVMRSHVYHCIDILRQNIQCSADRAVFGMVWIEDEKEPGSHNAFPQYSTVRQCQNYDDVKEWVYDNSAKDTWRYTKFRDGDKVFPKNSSEF